jgi:hypothetical protein
MEEMSQERKVIIVLLLERQIVSKQEIISFSTF